ncbi:hypothetical protein ONR75_13415 [Rhodopseudomonas sp. P2A-2r]|uniref:hypothetical protein n=1 Tax=Rhodopseudomonas sp. P2A-2r TaxID=2991972 RepID=UPI002234A772|nr:hypothetical protein [Rhodopseudomonas sp. P2A-2r]UZE51508.1 hypothetical protein ONR75_13415 [Rhodopseudomonas sp. P2A-2r]
MSWDLRFSEPIALANGQQLCTLRDAGTYITSLSPADHEAREWQTAMHVLIEAADHAGPVSFARLGVAQALHRHEEKVFDPSRKQPRWRKAASR